MFPHIILPWRGTLLVHQALAIGNFFDRLFMQQHSVNTSARPIQGALSNLRPQALLIHNREPLITAAFKKY